MDSFARGRRRWRQWGVGASAWFPRAWRCAPALPAVTGAHLARALDDLLDAAQAVTRTLLGVGVAPRPAIRRAL